MSAKAYKKRPLTGKQKKFCKLYVKYLNGTRAAKEAGYSEKTAYAIAEENLKKPDIKNYITKLQSDIDFGDITPEMVIAEMAKIAFANAQDFLTDNKIGNLSNIDRGKVAAISGIETEVTVDKLGSVTTHTKIKFHSKSQALEHLGRTMGIFEKDNNQREPVNYINVNVTPAETKQILSDIEKDI